MSDFPFKVGDKVRRARWTGKHVTITGIGRERFFADYTNDGETAEIAYEIEGDWEPYTPPPVRRRWTFETEDRAPGPGEFMLSVSGKLCVAHGHGYVSDWHVVVLDTLREVDQ